jgi:hypothetical protein
MIAMFANAAAQAVAWPEYVCPWRTMRPGSDQNGAATRSETSTPPSGR